MSEEKCSKNVFENGSVYSDLYKNSGKTPSLCLNERRKLFLQEQKEKRCQAADEKRDLSELFDDEVQSMDYELAVAKKLPNKTFLYGYKLMGSEWFTEIPDDLAENWIIKACPEGVRFLVVANKGKTCCYFENGKPSLKFASKLPGGSRQVSPNSFTVLDCIYNKNSRTFFVFDVLAWNSMSLINSEAQMRFFWLKSKFQENAELTEVIPAGKYNIVLIDFLPAQTDLLQDYLFTPVLVERSEVVFEGVLFYHKEGHYVFSRSPLVGWLKTYMLPEILHIDVALQHLKNKPEDYVSLEEYIKIKKKKRNRKGIEESVENVDMEEVVNEEFEDCDTDNM